MSTLGLLSRNRRGPGLAAVSLVKATPTYYRAAVYREKEPSEISIFAIIVFGFTLVGFAGAQTAFRNFNDAWGPRYRPSLQIYTPLTHPMPHGIGAANRIRHWNEIAINASGLDHTPVAVGENRTFGEQFGPTRASRAMAIVHIAIFESVNAIDGGFQSYAGLAAARFLDTVGSEARSSRPCAIFTKRIKSPSRLSPMNSTE